MEKLSTKTRADLSFEELMEIYNHIGEEERHFNELEVEYRKLASQWLLVALGAIGFILTKPDSLPVNVWLIIIGICLAACAGIIVLWLLDLRVYHELLHAAFKEGVQLEKEFPNLLPQIRNNMVHSLKGGDIISKVILYYVFSIMLLIVIANIALWMFAGANNLLCATITVACFLALYILYRLMAKRSVRHFSTISKSV